MRTNKKESKKCGAFVCGADLCGEECKGAAGHQHMAPLFPPPGLIGRVVYSTFDNVRGGRETTPGRVTIAFPFEDGRAGVHSVKIEYPGGIHHALYADIKDKAPAGFVGLSFERPRPVYCSSKAAKVTRAGAEYFIKRAEYPADSFLVKSRTTGEVADIIETAPEVLKVAREAFPAVAEKDFDKPYVVDTFGLYVVVKVWAAGCLPAFELK